MRETPAATSAPRLGGGEEVPPFAIRRGCANLPKGAGPACLSVARFTSFPRARWRFIAGAGGGVGGAAAEWARQMGCGSAGPRGRRSSRMMARPRRSRRAGRLELDWDHPLCGREPPALTPLWPRTGALTCGTRLRGEVSRAPGLSALALLRPFPVPPRTPAAGAIAFWHLPDLPLLDPLILPGQPPGHCPVCRFCVPVFYFPWREVRKDTWVFLLRRSSSAPTAAAQCVFHAAK